MQPRPSIHNLLRPSPGRNPVENLPLSGLGVGLHFLNRLLAFLQIFLLTYSWISLVGGMLTFILARPGPQCGMAGELCGFFAFLVCAVVWSEPQHCILAPETLTFSHPSPPHGRPHLPSLLTLGFPLPSWLPLPSCSRVCSMHSRLHHRLVRPVSRPLGSACRFSCLMAVPCLVIMPSCHVSPPSSTGSGRSL